MESGCAQDWSRSCASICEIEILSLINSWMIYSKVQHFERYVKLQLYASKTEARWNADSKGTAQSGTGARYAGVR